MMLRHADTCHFAAPPRLRDDAAMPADAALA